MFTIGKASEQSGVNIETIRYYEREGIVPKPGRSAGGRRLYSSDEIAKLRFVRRCRDLGFPISNIQTFLSLTPQDFRPASRCDRFQPPTSPGMPLRFETSADP